VANKLFKWIKSEEKMKALEFCLLEEKDFDEIVEAFQKIGWNKPHAIYKNYFKEQTENRRAVFIAKINNQFAGYITLKWQSAYKAFSQKNIPEICDLNVLPGFRKQGIGTKLIERCEGLAKEKGYKQIGLGVGLTENYGNAQRLYVQLGFIPDGKGLHHEGQAVSYYSNVCADDDLVLFLIKSL